VFALSGATGWLLLFQPNTNYNYVTNTNDDGPGSLRWSIANAQDDSTITFASTLQNKTITLTSSDIHITRSNLVIDNSKGVSLVINNNRSGLSMIVDASASVTMIGISFRNSYSVNNSSIFINHGITTLTNCTIAHNVNHSGHGGGVYNNGTLDVINSIIIDNTASYGGGIYNDNGVLNVNNSDISYNKTDFGDGGGISNHGTLNIIRSSIFGNIASFGGGISSSGALNTLNSIISHNIASDAGGGLESQSDKTLNITNSTISDNIAISGGGIAFYDDVAPNLELAFCTIYHNTAGRGSGIFVDDTGLVSANTNINIKASLVAGKDFDTDPSIEGKTITSGGYNLVQNMSSKNFRQDAARITDQTVEDMTKVFSSTASLKNNGGPTITYALRPSSDNPAINAIPRSACVNNRMQSVNTDQRELPRPGRNKPGKPACDIGAYESYN